MTKEDIIKTIVVALIGAFSKSLFDHLLGKYIPDKKKLNSYIISFLVFNLRYTLSAYFLVKAFFESGTIDKYFVFRVSIFTTVLFFNLLLDIFGYYIKRQTSHFDRLLTIVEKTAIEINDLENIVERLTDSLQAQVDITKKIVDKMPDKKNNGN